jgi:Na+-translocating ferredoxin:NAD+ oxidoreductase RnfE subunit
MTLSNAIGLTLSNSNVLKLSNAMISTSAIQPSADGEMLRLNDLPIPIRSSGCVD